MLIKFNVVQVSSFVHHWILLALLFDLFKLQIARMFSNSPFGLQIVLDQNEFKRVHFGNTGQIVT